MKKNRWFEMIAVGLAAVMVLCLSGCVGGSGEKDITVISREEGSGTRSAFTKLTGISKDGIDRTADSAEISNSTSVIIQSVAGNRAAIGYISMGSMNEAVKAVRVDGAEADTDNVKSGGYKIKRPFSIVTKEGAGDLTEDFIEFIMSDDGRKIIEEEGYITAGKSRGAYESGGLKGNLTLAGSTSVSPVIEVLSDRYKELNGGIDVEVQQTGSSAGIQSAAEGTCDIGLASRELKDEEAEQGLKSRIFAFDGIAVIVNNDNETSDLTTEQIADIFTGNITRWSDIK